MCGIAGIFNSPAPSADLAAMQDMIEAIAYRGPDASGIRQLGRTIFGHRRLAIIDLDSSADQPMTGSDENCMITFNGEIYNFQQLRCELASAGCSFRTNSDTEVILSLYQSGGTAALDRLDGMFAFAICDNRSGELILMRDRLGKKPLYYLTDPDGRVIFASTLPALKKSPNWSGKIDPAAVLDFLDCEYIPSNGSVYSQVRQVPPAVRVIFKPDGSSCEERYWQIDYGCKNDLSFEDASAQLREKIHSAVKRRLIADVPCGVFLSGGIDSAITAMTAARLSPEKLAAFTIGFSEKKYDERQTAALTANWINSHSGGGLLHQTRLVDCRSFDTLRKLSAVYGEPFADFSLLPTFFLSEFAAEKVKFVLSGDGADEIFGGYDRYRAMRYCAALNKFVPRPLLRALSSAAGHIFADRGKRSHISRICRLFRLAAAPESRRYTALMTLETEKFKEQLCGERLRAVLPHYRGEHIEKVLAATSALDPLEKCAECDLHTYLPGDILVKVDRASMANSLEVRSPFLDREVIEFAASLPFEYKQQGKCRKRILKHAMADCLSPQVMNLHKRGFAVPLAQWFRGEWKDLLTGHLLEGKLVSDNWIDRSTAARLITEHCSRHDHSEILGSLLMLELFLENE